MPRRNDIHTILVLGSGPIVIGQAAEFDYSGTQAVKALRAEGYRVILVNSNPATIMTDPEFADRTYVEPLTPDVVEQIIAREKPDALALCRNELYAQYGYTFKKDKFTKAFYKAPSVKKGVLTIGYMPNPEFRAEHMHPGALAMVWVIKQVEAFKRGDKGPAPAVSDEE